MSRTRAFFCGFCLTAAVLVPLIGCILLLRQTTVPPASQADAEASGVPLALPGPQDALTCLVIPSGEEDTGFLLVRMDAAASRLAVLGLPPQTAVLSPEGGAVLLGEALASAGPARAAELLTATLGLPIDYYLLASSSRLVDACTEFGAASVNLAGFSVPEAQAQVGQAPVRTLLPSQVGQALAEWNLPASQQAKLLAAVTAEFLSAAIRANPSLPAEALRTLSSHMTSNMDGNDIALVERVCTFLSRNDAEACWDTLPGQMQAGRFELESAAPDAAAELLGVNLPSKLEAAGSALPGTAGPASSSAARSTAAG